MNRLRILVTGHSGFLGRYLQRVAAYSPRFGKIEFVNWRNIGGNLLHHGAYHRCVASGNYDGLLHLAWLSTSAPKYEWQSENFRWAEVTEELAAACVDSGVWFLGVGSGLEHDATVEATPYLQAKRSSYAAIARLHSPSAFTWLRPFWIVSLPERRPRVLAEAMAAEEQGTSFRPREPGQLLDFIDVRDVASGILTALLSGLKGPQDIGTGELRSVDEMVSVALGTAPLTSSSLGSMRSPHALANTQRLTSLGWQPIYTRAFFGNKTRR